MTPALDNVRRLVEWNRQRHSGNFASDAARIKSVGIIGAGMMGKAIAAAHVEHGLSVVVNDANEAVLSGAAAAIEGELSDQRDDPIFAETKIGTVPAGVVRTTADLAEAARCDLVLESIVETLPAKERLYTQLRGHLASGSIVASNTSTIPIQRLAESVGDASRFCGIHFLHPVRRRLLVEIVRGPRSSDRTIAAATAHVRRIGREPIVVSDGPGFLVNRLLFPYLGEAMTLLREGTPADAIEKAAVQFGMAIGPLRMMDEIGLDTALQAGWVLAAAFPDRIVSSPILVSLIKAGRLGRKAGAGFYTYSAGGAEGDDSILDDPRISAGLDAGVESILARWIDSPRKPAPSGESIAWRLVLPMLLEATRILEEGKVSDPRDIDLAVLLGLGFPADNGGLLWWADALGPRRILAMLAAHCTTDDRHRPTPMLLELAESDGRFYRDLLQLLL